MSSCAVDFLDRCWRPTLAGESAPGRTQIKQVVKQMLAATRQRILDRFSAEHIVKAAMISVIRNVSLSRTPEDVREALLQRLEHELTHGQRRHLQ